VSAGELLAEARAALCTYVGADPDDLVFVPNATAGVNIYAGNCHKSRFHFRARS
jgi:selenocysteine lyase/cysteine desulfurase